LLNLSSADCCRDSDSGFCDLKELPFAYAERSGIDDRFSKAKKTPGKDWVISFSKRQNLSIRLPEKCGTQMISVHHLNTKL
jgi:hypothetical protein